MRARRALLALFALAVLAGVACNKTKNEPPPPAAEAPAPPAPAAQPVRVMAMFEEILPILETEATKNGVKVTTDVGVSTPSVNGDASMLRQAFLNLAINACQAMPQGGSLRLVAGPASRQRVEIRIEDTGVGIKPEHLSRIFDLYFTTKERGTGIGLSMVYRIIQMHDGEVEVQSTPGRGTTFRVLLPRANGV